MSIKVVKVNQQQNNFTYYMGRGWAGLPCSLFHNPYHVGRDGTREEVLLEFIAYWYASEQRQLREWAMKVIGPDEILGCWCRPLFCHCDIVAGYLNWKRLLQEVMLWV